MKKKNSLVKVYKIVGAIEYFKKTKDSAPNDLIKSMLSDCEKQLLELLYQESRQEHNLKSGEHTTTEKSNTRSKPSLAG